MTGDDATDDFFKEQVQGNKNAAAIPIHCLTELDKDVADFEAKVREINERVDSFETDHQAQTAAKESQAATRQVLYRQYGYDYPYRVVVDLASQRSMSDYAEHGSSGSLAAGINFSILVVHFSPGCARNMMRIKHGTHHTRGDNRKSCKMETQYLDR